MRGFARDIFGSAGGLLALLGILLSLVLGDALLHEETFAELGYALALLSMLGSAVYAGHLIRTFLRSNPHEIDLYSSFPTTLRATTGENAPGKRWPVLVSLLFSSFSFLFAGLAGWVEGYVLVAARA